MPRIFPRTAVRVPLAIRTGMVRVRYWDACRMTNNYENQAIELASVARCATWAGPLVCPIFVSGEFSNPPAPAEPQPVTPATPTAAAVVTCEHSVERGVEGARVKSAGFGAGHPVGGNHTATGRAQNRRIEFRVVSGN